MQNVPWKDETVVLFFSGFVAFVFGDNMLLLLSIRFNPKIFHPKGLCRPS